MKIGIIGCGNMGRAILGGLIKSGAASSQEVVVSDASEANRLDAEEKFGVRTFSENAACAKEADLVVFAVKPGVLPLAAADVRDVLREEQTVLSIAAGKSLSDLEALLGKKKIVRAMPNTPALVSEGITAWCGNEKIGEPEKAMVRTVLSSLGRCIEVREKLMSAVTAVSGSSPAFVFLFLEAMADAAVAEGMPRKEAYTFAAQTILGSAKLYLETEKHPGELKDMVCSPGGTTIEGVAELEKNGFRAAVIAAVRAAAEKARSL